MNKIVVKIISQEEVAEIFKNNVDSLFEVIEDAFRKYLHGTVLFPDKISQIFDQDTQNRINCMPATILGEDQVCGMKWVSVFPTNAPRNVQNVTGVMLLSELDYVSVRICVLVRVVFALPTSAPLSDYVVVFHIVDQAWINISFWQYGYLY